METTENLKMEIKVCPICGEPVTDGKHEVLPTSEPYIFNVKCVENNSVAIVNAMTFSFDYDWVPCPQCGTASIGIMDEDGNEFYYCLDCEHGFEASIINLDDEEEDEDSEEDLTSGCD